MIDIPDAEKLQGYLYKMAEIYDDEYVYDTKSLNKKMYIPLPDPNIIYEFCANVLISTKMEKEVIIISLICQRCRRRRTMEVFTWFVK